MRSFQIKRRTILTACLLVMIMLISGCQKSYRVGGKALEQYSSDELKTFDTYESNVITMFSSDTPEHLNSLSADQSITFDAEWEQWKQLEAEYGAYVTDTLDAGWKYGDDRVLTSTVQFGDAHFGMDTRWTNRGKLIEIYLYCSPEEEEAENVMPAGVEEIELTLNEGTDYELPAVLTVPDGAQNVPAAVLVQGNGANDKDYTAGNTHIYRDLAWKLAQQGIATLRYDKRTRVYSDAWSVPTAENMSVDWEIIDDAAAAGKLLANRPEVDSGNITLIGHSLGGYLAPRIDAAADGLFAKYILLAVPSRTWQEASFDQYLNYGLAGLGSNSDIYYAASLLDSQLEDINKKLDTFSDAELLDQSLMGMPGAYWKSLNSVDNVQAILDTEKPVLILQGLSDYQIVADVDFAGWQSLTEGKTNFTLQDYEGLNHLFMTSQGCFKGCSKEYDMPNHLNDAVIADIAAFIQ